MSEFSVKPWEFKPGDFLKLMLVGLLLVAFQGTFTAWLGRPGYGVEWVLILSVYVALRAPLWVAALAAFILGCLRDAAAGGLLGLYPFTLILLIWLFYPYRGRLNFATPLTLVPLIFLLTAGGYLFVMTPLMAVLGWPGRNFNPIPGFFVSSLASALAAWPVFALLNCLTRERENNA
ncbi:MAG: rod shape-determining protein MreD [Candidatus Adiutrix sp.]|nr:rod shape-determining protein MreD [Candidatus Adiutrix sp.]